MKIYIQWKLAYGDLLSDHILSIHKTNKSANATNTKIKKLLDDTTLIEAACMLRRDEVKKIRCTQMNINKQTRFLYFMKIYEDGGAEAYHHVCWLYVSTDKKKLIQIALNFFEEDHNRSQGCSKCESGLDKCRKKFIVGLENKGTGFIDATDDVEGITVNIWEYNCADIID